jgi:NAD(P)H-hydrate epimerase
VRVLNAAQMREADRRTIEEVGIASIVLMENAGRQVVGAMEATFEDLDNMQVAVLAGRGNNGGDGFVVARTLAERGVSVSVYLLGQASDVTGDARINLDILQRLGMDIVEIADAAQWELHGTDVLGADLIVDALYGTGLRGPLTGLAETVVADVNSVARPVVSIDLPSGLLADTAQIPGPAVDATVTVTIAAPKLPLVLAPAERLAGTLVIADIGIPDSVIDSIDGQRVEVLTRTNMRPLVEARPPDSHKGDYGRVLVVGGSRGKSGAAALAAMAALRSGAGLVTVASPRSTASIVATLSAELMTVPVDEAPDGTLAGDTLDLVLDTAADVIVVGPGLGRTPSTIQFVTGLLERSGVPVVLDADALNVFEGQVERLVGREDSPVIITPHPGEMARLVGLSTDAVQSNRVEIAREFATTHRVHVVLKGHRTLVASPEGVVAINLTGNPGMATAGTGDVLAGMIGGWFGQLLDADAAARLAVYLHGLAGDLAEADEGEVALMAGDIIDRLGDAVLDLTARRRRTPQAS